MFKDDDEIMIMSSLIYGPPDLSLKFKCVKCGHITKQPIKPIKEKIKCELCGEDAIIENKNLLLFAEIEENKPKKVCKFCNQTLNNSDILCPKCGNFTEGASTMKSNNEKKEQNDEIFIVCSYCHGIFSDDDKFCKHCGKKRKEEKIDKKILYRTMPCIYGPPMRAKYFCKHCGHSFTEHGLGSPKERYCPKCGKKCQMTRL